MVHDGPPAGPGGGEKCAVEHESMVRKAPSWWSPYMDVHHTYSEVTQDLFKISFQVFVHQTLSSTLNHWDGRQLQDVQLITILKHIWLNPWSAARLWRPIVKVMLDLGNFIGNHWSSKTQRSFDQYMFKCVVYTVHADDLAPLSARASADTELTIRSNSCPVH